MATLQHSDRSTTGPIAADSQPASSVAAQQEAGDGYRSRLMPGHVSIRLLTLLLRKPPVAFIAVGLAAFALAFLVIHVVNPHTPTDETFFGRFGDESQTTVTSLLIALVIVPAAVVLVLWKMFFALIAIARESAEKGRAPVLPFLAETVDQMGSQLNELHGDGVELESYQVASWVRRCFQTAGPTTRYIGTDSHIPSEYEAVYTDYLKAQRLFLEKSSLQNHVRVLIAEMGELRSDKFGSSSYQDFVEWHEKNKVKLQHLDPDANKIHLSAPGMPSELLDTDIGFWEGKYVLLFRPIRASGERERTKLRIAYVGDPLYEKCEEYVSWLLANTAPVGDELPFYPEKLSTGWEEFCDPKERITHTMPLLENVIGRVPHEREDVRIFDAATGIGIETTELIRRGYFVAANEIESSLRTVAKKYAERHGVKIPFARFSYSDWLHLEDQHDEHAYDLVLVVGNSLCHLEGPEQLEIAFKQFARLLRPGGALVCDERNFQYITERWTLIEPDPWNQFRFNQRPAKDRVMYYGDSVHGAPIKVTDKGRIIFQYVRVERDDDDGITPVRGGELGALSMYPFKRGDMLKALRGMNQFKDVEIYCDLQPADALSDDADFYTYVAWKDDPSPPDSK